MIQRKVKCVFQDDEALKKLLEADMDASLPDVYLKPQGITYKVRNVVGYFRLKYHLTPHNRSQIINLIEQMRRKRELNEDEKKIVQIMQSYIASLSNLKGSEEKAPSGKRDKDEEEEDKNDSLKKKKGKNVNGEDKKDPDQGKEKVYKTSRGGCVK